MAANHTAMFEVPYQVRQLISLTHKICRGRNMPSHKKKKKMHIFTPKPILVLVKWLQNTDMKMVMRRRRRRKMVMMVNSVPSDC